MAYEELCKYCFQNLNGASVCPHCGKDANAPVPQVQLMPGTTVHGGRFLLGRALGQDGSGIVYNALDTRKGGTIRIREYLPRNCAERNDDGTVSPMAGMEETFREGMEHLRASAESAEDPRKRHFYFEENGTAYIAQRKTAAAAARADEADEELEEEEHKKSIALYIAIAAAVVVALAIGIILLLNSMSEPQDVTTLPSASIEPDATWLPQETPTPTPYATPTFAALTDPELSWMDYSYGGDVEAEYQAQVNAANSATATPAPALETFKPVNTASASSAVNKLQARLIALGWMDDEDASGKYDSTTRSAVKAFQQYVNDYCNPAEPLEVDGIAGTKTQQWLYSSSAAVAKPVTTPSASDKPVTSKSSRKEILAAQKKLITLGCLEEGQADGKLGQKTVNAIKYFQAGINKLLGYTVLDVNGELDEMTVAYLNYSVSWWNQNRATATPEPTAVATPTPTAAPITPEPTEAPDLSPVAKNSSKARIRYAQQMLKAVGASKSTPDGIYGSGTVASVKRFQQYINYVYGAGTLPENGALDANTMTYLYNAAVAGTKITDVTATATPEPTAEPTEEPEKDLVVDVDESAPVESITYVQEMLRDVGLLSDKNVTGIYDSATTEAVKNLQTYMNNLAGKQVVTVDGKCNDTTRRALEYAFDREINIAQAMATEFPFETPKTSATPTPEVDRDENGDPYVDAASSVETILAMQHMLQEAGLLEEGSATGAYDAATTQAIMDLQTFVNQYSKKEVLTVDGECNAKTLEYLKYVNKQGWNVGSKLYTPAPTEEPTPTPTAVPTATPTAEPQIAEITGFSLMLDGMSSDSDAPVEFEANSKYTFSWDALSGAAQYHVVLADGSGNVLKEGTAKAGSFELKTAGITPDEVYTLTVTAIPENGTEADGITKVISFTVPTPATPEPTEAPTPTPAPQVAEITGFTLMIDSKAADSDTNVLQANTQYSFTWDALSGVDSYYVRLTDSTGKVLQEGSDKNGGINLNTNGVTYGEVYTITVTAIPVNGTAQDGITKSMSFTVEAPATPEPTEAPTPTPAPQAAEITGFTMKIDGKATDDSTQILEAGQQYSFTWDALSGVDSYYVSVTDSQGNVLKEGSDKSGGFKVNTNGIPYGETYTITVTAVPENGTLQQGETKRIRFVVDAPATAEPTERPTATPEPEPAETPKPYVSAPSISIGSAAYTKDGITYINDDTIIFSWNADGDVEAYDVYLLHEDGTQYTLGTVTSTSKTISTSQLPGGKYRLYVGAIPEGGSDEDTVWSNYPFVIPESEPEPEPEPEYEEPDEPEYEEPSHNSGSSGSITSLNTNSSASDIQTVQMALYSLGLLNTDNATAGVLDEATLEAVAAYQEMINDAYDMGLPVLDPYSSSSVDAATLDCLLNQKLK